MVIRRISRSLSEFSVRVLSADEFGTDQEARDNKMR